MADNSSQRICEADRTSHEAVLEDEDLIRLSISRYLRDCGIQNFEALAGHVLGSEGAGMAHLHARPLNRGLLIKDARTSIVMALQRHLTNEQYRTRLAVEFHYCAFRPHLSEGFRLQMVRQSNWDKSQFFAGRNPNLAAAYQDEIELLEAKWLSGARMLVDRNPLTIARKR